MKDKKAVLVEVEQLKSIRDELTTEVASLTTDLEKERSSVRSLKDEITKLKVCTYVLLYGLQMVMQCI